MPQINGVWYDHDDPERPATEADDEEVEREEAREEARWELELYMFEDSFG